MSQIEVFWFARDGCRVGDSANARRPFGGVAKLGRHVSLMFGLVLLFRCYSSYCSGLNEVASSWLL